MNNFAEEDGIRNMEEEDEEEEEDEQRMLAKIMLHSAPFPFPQKMNVPGLNQYCSAVAWCGKSNIVACATEICARDPGSKLQPAFWIPVHIFDPERPTEHAIFNVTADSPKDAVEFLEWSPVCCTQALLIGNASGRVSVWSQPTQGSANVSHTINCWCCEHEWRQEQAATIKWVAGPSPYRFQSTPPMSAPSSKSVEERFLAHVPRSSVRWPNFLCICLITYSGLVQLHWRPWPSGSSTKWLCTNKAVLGAGPSGIFASDAIINDTGSLIVAGTPVGTPSTVIVWEISPGSVNHTGGSQPPLKYGVPVQTPLAFGPPPWAGISPLAAYLMSWQEHPSTDTKPAQWVGQVHVENEEKAGPMLLCSPISNLSAYVAPDASTLSTWGSGVAEIAFDPSRGGSALLTMICEGYFISPDCPDEGPYLTGWRFQRWESSRQPVAIHPLFENGSGAYPASPPANVTSWIAVASQTVSPKGSIPGQASAILLDKNAWKKFNSLHRPTNPRCVSKILFSAHGGEFAISIASGEVYLFSGSSLTPVDNFMVRIGLSYPPGLAFSPTSCCMALAWHSKKDNCSVLKISCIEPTNSAATQAGMSGPLLWERHLADRFWWSLVSELDWWDVIACAQYAVEDGAVTVARVAAVLDADFHALSNPLHRQHYSKALDRIKCRMLEGTDAADIRALVLDMQARLLLDMLGKGVEAALTNPATLFAEPWLASGDTLSGLGPDAMTVDPALVPSIQAYVDSILDLASHFLTRLRRYASFCRTLASHSSGITGNRPGVNLSNGGTLSTQAGQGSAVQSNSGNSTGTAGVNAWVQSAIAVAKGNNSAEGATANAAGSGAAQSAPLPLTVSTATFPGIPAVRLIGDCQFLHRLCQLLFFCVIFRKRQLPRFVAGPRMAAADSASAAKSVGGVPPKTEETSSTSGMTRSSSGVTNVKTEDGTRGPQSSSKSEEPPNPRSARVGSGNAGQGYTSEEVKYLFIVLVDLCKRTSKHPHPMPKSQVGIAQPIMRLHYVDGQYSVTPEVVEQSLGPHMQPQLPRPRGADAAGLLMRELELHPPAEEWNRRCVPYSPWSTTNIQDNLESVQEEDQTPFGLWPRKRRYAERDAALGLRTAIGLGSYSAFLGSRRDVVTGVWKTAHHAIWHKCLRCGRQTASLTAPTLASGGSAVPPTSNREAWWTARWTYGCPMCGGRWARMM